QGTRRGRGTHTQEKIDKNNVLADRLSLITVNANGRVITICNLIRKLIENVQGTIDWAKDKLPSFKEAGKDHGSLLDALSQSLTQIVGGVTLLLAGVLNLLASRV
ncbi:hypothetical protein AN958_10669, partial [Leucoagaricus sp. SymC.cos]